MLKYGQGKGRSKKRERIFGIPVSINSHPTKHSIMIHHQATKWPSRVVNIKLVVVMSQVGNSMRLPFQFSSHRLHYTLTFTYENKIVTIPIVKKKHV